MPPYFGFSVEAAGVGAGMGPGVGVGVGLGAGAGDGAGAGVGAVAFGPQEARSITPTIKIVTISQAILVFMSSLLFFTDMEIGCQPFVPALGRHHNQAIISSGILNLFLFNSFYKSPPPGSPLRLHDTATSFQLSHVLVEVLFE